MYSVIKCVRFRRIIVIIVYTNKILYIYSFVFVIVVYYLLT